VRFPVWKCGGAAADAGVGFDFVRSLRKEPRDENFGRCDRANRTFTGRCDAAVLTAHEKTQQKFQTYNVATAITYGEEIAELAVVVGLDRSKVKLSFRRGRGEGRRSGGAVEHGQNRGWVGRIREFAGGAAGVDERVDTGCGIALCEREA